MMAVLDSILPVVSRSSALALGLYRVAASCPNEAAKDLIHAASTTNSFASTLKQIGTIIKEDDRLPSHEVCRTS
jgi:phosphohistidine swiveling domain-containing protein|tara:strand:- start:37690 stop:37911 length:222 start_codon:yes stop_codon:yes gene_type:complete